MAPAGCARNVWSDGSARFKVERRATFFDQKVETFERSTGELNPWQLKALKRLRWTDRGQCWEDVAFFYTMKVYDRAGNEEVFHAPNWNCGPDEKKRYIDEEAMYLFFRTLKQ